MMQSIFKEIIRIDLKWEMVNIYSIWRVCFCCLCVLFSCSITYFCLDIVKKTDTVFTVGND